ncbi:AarF/UbiB family protein [Christiangramia forsetii]|uniref:ABC1 family protein n=2 Tax=Christiangramia forsetii TaxID=411153 RepID=A0M2T6_CHRFK|nr:AarF/UbiB family protein [Christiangramia forsetii]GGG44583.1 ABC transporter substrate-binding protein [Christiangramia forsetii]CAL66931.1 ABC1 family protein [Christiangramia forsetii KT0803]
MSNTPDKIKRYYKFIHFMLKYWNSDLFRQTSAAALNDTLEEEDEDHKFDQSPEELVEDLKQMGPTYIKLGQLLSTRPDLLPDNYLKALANLQDNVSPVPFGEIKEIIEKELGTKISRAFNSFDETPLASASIGQVHRAELHSGRPVAVKVQRPGIAKQFMEDLDTLDELTALAVNHLETAKTYAIDEVFAELRRILINELDYNKEAQNLKTLKRNLQQFEHLIIPAPVDDYSSTRVLTMEFVSGKKITSLSPLRQMENDFSELVEELVEAYLQQIINDGFAHADPHPGNIKFTDDNKIALIDLGMVARFSPKLQENLIELLLAISQSNGEKTAHSLLKMSELTEESQKKQFSKTVSDVIMESEHSRAKDLQTGRILIQLNRLALSTHIKLPVEINILGKILLNLDQIVAMLDPEFDLRAAIQRNVHEIMRKKMLSELKPENFFSTLIESKHFIEKMPERMNQISENLANNEFKIKIDAIDEKRVTDGFQKVANRITLGLIIASMIIGASMLMQVPSDFTIFGYPGLAMLFFLLAAVGAIVLSYVIIFRDENLNNKN